MILLGGGLRPGDEQCKGRECDSMFAFHCTWYLLGRSSRLVPHRIPSCQHSLDGLGIPARACRVLVDKFRAGWTLRCEMV